MVYYKYGHAFRDLRLQHNLPMSAFEELGITKATISNFENGKNMIAFDKLDMALQEMHVTLLDYSLVLNNGELDYFIVVFQDIENSYYQNNVRKLKYIYEEIMEQARQEDVTHTSILV